MEFTQTVNVQANNDVEIGRKVREIKRIAAEPAEVAEPDGSDKPADPSLPSNPPAPVPYFDIGEATGIAGQTVKIVVEAGCQHEMTGFHVAGGVGLIEEVQRSGYGKFRALGARLGPYLRRYLKSQDVIHDEPDHVEDHFLSIFNFVDWSSKALPEEWWEFAVGLLSIDQKRMLDPISVPAGTHLFTLEILILPDTARGVYELTCEDERYYTQSRRRRRDLTWTYSPLGFTKVETFPGKITVL